MEALFLTQFDERLDQQLNQYAQRRPEAKKLVDSMSYSLNTGGKRFRPYLSYIIAEHFHCADKVWPLALAIEFVHTYSLIHDDLPILDNDDYRRGKLTNHKVYGEPMALLAGDALLTEAFGIISDGYSDQPDVGLKLVSLLTHKAGIYGMITGQVMDISVTNKLTIDELQLVHFLKTSAMIEASVLGAAIVCQLPPSQFESLKIFSRYLGLAFQIKDDLLDADQDINSPKNYITHLGAVETQNKLKEASQTAEKHSLNIPKLMEIIRFNLERNS